MPSPKPPSSRQMAIGILETDLDVNRGKLPAESFEHHLADEAASEKHLPALAGEFNTLLETLRKLRRGVSILGKEQKRVLAGAPLLVERMAAESDRMASEAQEHDEDDKGYHMYVAETLRQSVIPQLQTLVAHLKITVNQPRAM